MYICTYVYIYIYIYTYMCIYISLSIYIYIYCQRWLRVRQTIRYKPPTAAAHKIRIV